MTSQVGYAQRRHPARSAWSTTQLVHVLPCCCQGHPCMHSTPFSPPLGSLNQDDSTGRIFGSLRFTNPILLLVLGRRWPAVAEARCTSAGGYSVPVGQDVMISVYNIHRSPAVWDAPNEFRPERFPLDEPVPTEQTTDYRCAQPYCQSGLQVRVGLGFLWVRAKALRCPGRLKCAVNAAGARGVVCMWCITLLNQ